MIDRSDPLWFKDAIIYQTHVKAYFDGDNDGMGDFAGLIQKLDYIQDLGVSCLWLLPFYPSPLRDDGYDIGDYRRVHPSYGDLGDFKRVVREAHARGLRVITELVINHTSDAHPWFQRARKARKGSRFRDYYVWSDSDQRYKDSRIIFIDTEKSNWTWDTEAQAYFWHRFYSHQPDLNFDNPAVLREVLDVLHYWLKMGIDGLRLDAIPYLIEREGTSCENLPETHEVLKRIRAEMDEHYPDRMLLAEANQWPEDTRPYFGEGDECHMAFHFPLMPRMYMAIAQEDRNPITDIMRQTPEIPDTTQWAIFLRNHDELTLEMVTEEERRFLWSTYAADARARLNLGIRRRLAPLMDNDRRKIELMNGLLFSMPGTPVVYYGDEIGMGDNIFLGDRDGVRTPMQWSSDRNAGFSRAMPQRLFLPPIMDPVYGYDAINVEAQQQSPSSLLNWMKRMISVRQGHAAFGRGDLTFIYPRNRKILAYVRKHAEDLILCVFNLSRSAQAFDLDLAFARGRVPVELLGRTAFPPVEESQYRLALPGFGFYWFALTTDTDLPSWHMPAPEPLPEFITLVLMPDWRGLASGRPGRDLAEQALPEYLMRQRWFAAKDAGVAGVALAASVPIPLRHPEHLLNVLEVKLRDGEVQRYFLPLSVTWGESSLASGSSLLPFTVAKARRGSRIGALHDGLATDDLPRVIVRLIEAGLDVETESGTLVCRGSDRLAEIDLSEPAITVRRFGAEQSNTSLILGDAVILKAYRRLQSGVHPELEIGRFLTDVAGFSNIPPLLGSIEAHATDGTSTALVAALGFVSNQGDGWRYTLEYLDRTLEAITLTSGDWENGRGTEAFAVYVDQARLLGRRTAEMHRAFAIDTDDPDFAREPITADDLGEWVDGVMRQVETGCAAASRVLERKRALEGNAEDIQELTALLGLRPRVEAELEELRDLVVDAMKTRLHGDFHLGQVLVTLTDFVLIDFEGEPSRPIEERRAKMSPFKDVAGMLRSFDYAAWASIIRFDEADPAAFARLFHPAMRWRELACENFFEGYREAIAGCPVWPSEGEAADKLLRLYLLEKAFYEVAYEAANRPNWVRIPVRGVLSLYNGLPREEPDA